MTIHIDHVVIDGETLTIEQIVAVARYNKKVSISTKAIHKMEESQAIVLNIQSSDKVVYGITTGFGKFSTVRIDQESIEKLQENLILSHAVGVGEPIKEEAVRAMLLLRANALSKGYSGIRPEVVGALVNMLNEGIHPIVPEKGSLGASGDLAPLSHMILVLIGKGEATYQGKRMPGKEAMEKAGIPIVKLQAKEGLALINGTQAMTAIGALALYDAECLAKSADIVAAVTIDALEGLVNAFDNRVQEVRPHPGQALVSNNIRKLLEGSEIIAKAVHGRVQDAYSLRCIPQIHGATRDVLSYVRKVIETEINSVTDNPIIFPEDRDVISGGNFHGQPLAFAFDFLGIAIAELANVSERRIERLVNPALNGDLPAFLTKNGGLNSGYMICQYSAASLVSENKVLAHPASVDSIPSSANQEDHVSMGMIAARKARTILENTADVLAFELLCAAQAIDLRGGKPGKGSGSAYEAVRKVVPFMSGDRELRFDVANTQKLIREEVIIDKATEAVGSIG